MGGVAVETGSGVTVPTWSRFSGVASGANHSSLRWSFPWETSSSGNHWNRVRAKQPTSFWNISVAVTSGSADQRSDYLIHLLLLLNLSQVDGQTERPERKSDDERFMKEPYVWLAAQRYQPRKSSLSVSSSNSSIVRFFPELSYIKAWKKKMTFTHWNKERKMNSFLFSIFKQLKSGVRGCPLLADQIIDGEIKEEPKKWS